VKDPQRLGDQADLPDALYEALRGLRQDAPPADAVARIQRTLSSLPVPPVPPVPTRPGGAESIAAKSGSSASAFKAAALAVGALAAAVVATIAMRAPLPAARERELPATAALPLPAAPVASGKAPALEPLQQSLPPAAAPPEPRAVQRRREPQKRSLRDTVPAETTHAALPTPEIRGAATLADAPTGEPAPQARAAAEQPPAPEDEASLLYRAKKAARTDHRAALHMLEQHATHFPHGTLVEEREVLAIDLLRRMGREPEAKQRSAQFLRQFPQSSYRSAITR
jgi:hypothetical protein